jgi:Na+/melibiose symporter-like transporter
MNNQYAPPSADLDHLPNEGTGITNAMLEALRKTKGWVMLVGIMLFVAAAFTILAALVMVFASSMLGTDNGMPRGVTIGMGVGYFIFALVYGALGFYLVKYSSAISQLNRDGSSESMEIALQHQQKFWRLAGVLMLLFLLFFVFAIGAAIVIPGMTALKGLPS